jgi:CRP-like cAMP-binding protein
MNASAQTIDNDLFKGFTPLNSLDHHSLEKLARHATIQGIEAGNFLFERGDTKAQTLFLLEGEIELCSPVFPTHKVSADSDAGRYPLAHSFPRQFTALTVSDVRILILPFDILEVIPLDAAKGRGSSTSAPSDAWKSQWLNSPMLRNLPAANKEALLSRMEEIRVQAGQVIIHQEEPADSYFVIKNGRCSVSRRPAPGARDVKLAELTEGQGFGEEALITNVARNASVTMLNDGILLRLAKQDFIALLARPLLHHLPFQNAIELVEQGAVLIDVRAPEEFEIDGLIGSLNMPLPVLRLKANRLHRDCTYIVYSNTGHFSSVAAFLLIQQGLKAYVLLGGLSTAPKYRMKRGAFNNDHGSEAQDTTAASNKVLPFPHGDDAQHSNTFNPPRNNSPANKRGHSEVDWNLISDDVLWRTTIGYRQDASVEAAISAKPGKEQQPPADTTLQGFDDIKLFTTINSLKDIKIGDGDEPRPVADFSQISGPRSDHPAKTLAHNHHESPHRSNKSYQRVSRRSLIALLAILLSAGGGFGYVYLTTGTLPRKLEEAPPLVLEQQRKLDAKMSRLLDAIESMPALQNRTKGSNDPATANTASLPPANDIKQDPSANIPQGQIIRK